MSAKRLVGDRVRRIWHLVEEIAANPGHTRVELADLFHLSERQTQADMVLIREQMGLPLVRNGGYRFVSDDGSSQGGGALLLTLADALVMLASLLEGRRTLRDTETINTLINKVPAAWPLHVQPLVRLLADEALARGYRPATAVCWSVQRGDWIGLRYVARDTVETTEMLPEMVVPWQGRWYAVGEARDGRTRMLALDAVQAVLPAVGGVR